MKHTLMLTAATVLILGLSGIALAGVIVRVDCNVNGNDNWTDEKLYQMVDNRLFNAGIGNLGEYTSANPDGKIFCLIMATNGEWDHGFDTDPGNSRDHNANNRKDQ